MKKRTPKAWHYVRTRGGKEEHYVLWKVNGVTDWRFRIDGDDIASPVSIGNAVARVQGDLNEGRDPLTGSVDIDTWIGDFETWLKGRRAKNTVAATMRPLRMWRAWLLEKHPALASPRDLSFHRHVEPFESWLLAQPKMVPAKGVHNFKGAAGTHVPDPSGKTLSKRTVNLHMQGIRVLCSWSLEPDEKERTRGYLRTDPTAPRKRLREPDPETKVLELPAAQAVEAYIGNGRGDSALVHARVHRIMIETGRRTHELFGCKRGDLQADTGRLRYRDHKTGAAKHCDLSPRAVAWLKTWAARGGDDKALIPVSRAAFVSRLARACKKLGLPRYGPHTLRHTHATWLLDQGANLRQVQESLDHRRVETTTRYTHVSRGALTAVIGKLHTMPVDNLVDKGKIRSASRRKR